MRLTLGAIEGRAIATVEHSGEPHPDRCILFVGTGWYSLADDGVYYYGIAPTYSRIKLTDSGE